MRVSSGLDRLRSQSGPRLTRAERSTTCSSTQPSMSRHARSASNESRRCCDSGPTPSAATVPISSTRGRYASHGRWPTRISPCGCSDRSPSTRYPRPAISTSSRGTTRRLVWYTNACEGDDSLAARLWLPPSRARPEPGAGTVIAVPLLYAEDCAAKRGGEPR